ncbi:probable phosphate transporter [marine gamma proteobacterium HTCC2207]|jgi:PiT family inorganic phosphate transporter|uniref:Phosphate transporter n=1 Tax=gamma proteobacterium HTCC2207 TaxID=314287 RepID=Q1YUU8_9GAMM|nr:probable phosphate transporter [marine gamma proteobacterium HTCC2207] [gamma proteobacterium HTCC2207]MBT5105085.1 inorganic phosphate transporter [Porticoccaceae bacterium]MBT6114962.1 inorganic phosphate transporter [Porticoccaceae bacterium]MBT6594339.1 inorganic phosphate transporter [Porticoccaceae bacterium]MDG1080467.1 inorganic phosphate transporter [Porticoccaceae bacterium]
MEFFTEYGTILILLAACCGFFMAWGVGANDVANAMGTSVGSKALTIKQAILIAMVFEFAGAYLAGGEVTSTIRKGIVDSAIFKDRPEDLVFGMLSALLAAGSWLAIASFKGWPVSTTHSIVGAIVGFAAVGVSPDAVNWGKVGTIVMSWLVSPIMAGTLSFALFRSVQHLILLQDDPFTKAKRYIPIYMFFVGFLIAMVTLLKGLKHVFKDNGMSLTFLDSALIASVVGVLVAILGSYLLSKVKRDLSLEADNRFANVERVFAVLMIFTACSMAFAHGSNDVANAVGPLAAVVSIVGSGGDIAAKTSMPPWILLLGGGGIVVGLATYGYKVMGTIGRKITELTPSRGFAAELGAAATVVIASGTGLPISTTHTLVGAVLGVGLARGIGAIDLRMVGSIFLSWLVTLPAGAGLSIMFFFVFKAAFGQ